MEQTDPKSPIGVEKSQDESVDLVDHNLSLSHEQRLIQHQNALDTINELIKAREQLYGKPQSSTQAPT